MEIIFISYIIGVAISLMTGATPADFEQTPLSQQEQKEIVQLQSDISEEPDDVENHLHIGQIYFKHNRLDDSGKAFEAAKIIEPEAPEVLAWWGSLRTKKGGEIFPWFWGIRKIMLVKQGVAALEKAVQKAPDNPIIRLIRMNTLIGLKGRFSNFDKVFDDDRYFNQLLSEQPQSIPKGLQAAIHLAQGKLSVHLWKSEQDQTLRDKHLKTAMKFILIAEQEDSSLKDKIKILRQEITNNRD